jgi:hypothetical protein
MISVEERLFFLLVFSLLVIFLLPIWMRRIRGVVRGKSPFFQLFCFFSFEFFLGLSVFLSFFSAWFSFEISILILPSWMDMSLSRQFWDEALTPRSFVFISAVFLTPYLVFSRIGLLAIRDVHQLCKEQREVVAGYYELPWWWRGL